jgi:hypothetical protein
VWRKIHVKIPHNIGTYDFVILRVAVPKGSGTLHLLYVPVIFKVTIDFGEEYFGLGGHVEHSRKPETMHLKNALVSSCALKVEDLVTLF